MIVRLEETKDYREVENLTREAFWNVYRPGCTEHYVLNQYRTNPDFIPELDFVMEEGDGEHQSSGKIIGHVMFSKAEIMLDDGTAFPSWTFGPISIHPDYKRRGYGLKLLKYALEAAKEMGIALLQMEGNIEFYKHAGFDLASKMNIHYHAEPRESEVPYFLAQELIPGYWGRREGTYCPPKGYFVADENPEAFEAYEATFPQKEKLRLPGQISDIADGWLARKLKCVTRTGALLDSVADICFVACCAWMLLPILELPQWLWLWAGVIVAIKVVNQLSALVMYGHCCFPHTTANKATGFLLFIAVPMTFLSIIPIVIVASVATFAAIHEGHFIRTNTVRTIRYVKQIKQ